ncbi:uncharacterized protein LOC141620717 [Silene latifolia]|uniref:uncharacterized protein LOC141620717 n=1 Tax=Silene latifolia TaxID=37657 RepID=UPI003D772722
MIHGPCGELNPDAPCMIDRICSKKFPKRFNERTTVDGDGYPVYKRRENGTTIMKNGKTIHNGYVVPYNADLLLKYRAHINVEWCNQERSIKYLFKYINKEYDRVTVSATRSNNGPKSYKDIRTVNGVPHTTFKEACYALGLLGDDKEYIDAIKEASYWGTGFYFRNLFATLLLTNSLVKPELVWEKTWKLLSDDILHRRQTELRNPDLQLTDEQLQTYALSEIESWLQRNGSTLRKFDNMPYPDVDILATCSNRLFADELSYDKDALKKKDEVLTSSMTDEQKSIYRKIMYSVQNGQGGVYFVYGYGGTGKTFLWKTLCAGIRSKGEIVIAVASSGIAAILVPGGRTTYA